MTETSEAYQQSVITPEESISAAREYLQSLTNGESYQLYRPDEAQSSRTGPIVWSDANLAIQSLASNVFMAHDTKRLRHAVRAASITAEDIRNGISICYSNGQVTVMPKLPIQKENNALEDKWPATSAISERQADAAIRPLLRNVIYDGYDYAVLVDYFGGIGSVMKRYQGSFIGQKESSLYRYWRFRKQTIEAQLSDLYADLIDCAGDRSVESIEAFSAKFDVAKLSPDVTAFTADLKERIYPIQAGGVAIMGSYHSKVIAIVKGMGGYYLPTMKAWYLNKVSSAVLKNNLLTEMSLRDEQVEIMDGVYSVIEDALYKAEHEDTAHIHTANNDDGPTDSDETEADGGDVFLAVMTPFQPSQVVRTQVDGMLEKYGITGEYAYQGDGVWHLVSQTSALLGDDMGLGKSRQAAVAADILLALQPDQVNIKLLIICPASLIINWTREIAMIDPEGIIATQKWDQSAKWIVTNYEQMEQLIPYAKQFLVMIIDEAHLLKEVTAMRTHIGFDIASQVPYRYLLTGTPILNRERELHTLLRLSGHPIGNIPLRQFEKEFAGSPEFRRQLNKRISEWMLRRTKDGVLKNLKGKQRQPYFVSVSDEQRSEYELIANDASLRALPKITRLRQKLESIKIEATMEMFSEMQADDKILIFCEYRETVEELRRRFEDIGIKVVTMIGTDSNRKRQRAVDAFQDDPSIRVFIGTTRAAGVGINLTAANYVIFVSLPWTPALKNQAEDRAYRNGQTRLVIVKIPLIDGTIDIDLWEMLKHKHKIAIDILDADESEDAAMEEFALSWAKAA